MKLNWHPLNERDRKTNSIQSKQFESIILQTTRKWEENQRKLRVKYSFEILCSCSYSIKSKVHKNNIFQNVKTVDVHVHKLIKQILFLLRLGILMLERWRWCDDDIHEIIQTFTNTITHRIHTFTVHSYFLNSFSSTSIKVKSKPIKTIIVKNRQFCGRTMCIHFYLYMHCIYLIHLNIFVFLPLLTHRGKFKLRNKNRKYKFFIVSFKMIFKFQKFFVKCSK